MFQSRPFPECHSLFEHGVAMRLEPLGADPAPVVQAFRRLLESRGAGLTVTDVRFGRYTYLVLYPPDPNLFALSGDPAEITRHVNMMIDWLFSGIWASTRTRDVLDRDRLARSLGCAGRKSDTGPAYLVDELGREIEGILDVRRPQARQGKERDSLTVMSPVPDILRVGLRLDGDECRSYDLDVSELGGDELGLLKATLATYTGKGLSLGLLERSDGRLCVTMGMLIDALRPLNKDRIDRQLSALRNPINLIAVDPDDEENNDFFVLH